MKVPLPFILAVKAEKLMGKFMKPHSFAIYFGATVNKIEGTFAIYFGDIVNKKCTYICHLFVAALSSGVMVKNYPKGHCEFQKGFIYS